MGNKSKVRSKGESQNGLNKIKLNVECSLGSGECQLLKTAVKHPDIVHMKNLVYNFRDNAELSLQLCERLNAEIQILEKENESLRNEITELKQHMNGLSRANMNTIQGEQ